MSVIPGSNGDTISYQFMVQGKIGTLGVAVGQVSLPRTTIKRPQRGFDWGYQWLDREVEQLDTLSLPPTNRNFKEPREFEPDEAWIFFANEPEVEDLAWFVGSGDCPAIVPEMALQTGLYYVFTVKDDGTAVMKAQHPHQLLAMAQVKKLIAAGLCPLALVYQADARDFWQDDICEVNDSAVTGTFEVRS